MAIKKVCEKIILIILTISILLSFMVTPVSNAGLDLGDGEFYYSGTTKGTYVLSEGIFSWLIDNLGMIADWILGLCTMGIRMVVVGWTALIEKLLTWSVESAGGISNNGGMVVDSTDVTAIGDSSGNLTIEAIVYNRVPLFDINFFNLELDRTVSPTGHVLRCETCKKTCEECCGITEETIENDTLKNLESGKDAYCTNCTDGGCSCSNCQQYLSNWLAEEPIVIKIREFVAMWYTIIRLLSMIAMLIALLGIGIKMAFSTIASEKAVYKRMFFDWVVGMIILFAMHYFIFFIITINETLVATVRDTASSINKIQIQFVNAGNKTTDSETGEEIQAVDNQEIEVSVYEEIRSRAYDAKLSVGLSGLIMYITLVYFAIRYSIAYLKRYLTVIVLSLMAPPLGVAYALQKALSGRSSSLKKWMTEFVMTVIIQIVHALIYAVFISTALALSLESVAGMIVALIFMNFALKAEKMFRQIFKMGEGDSLAGSAAEAGSAEKMQSTFNAVKGLYTSAKPIAGAMMNTPIAKGIKSAGKIGLAGAAVGGNALVGAFKKEKGEDSGNSTTSDSSTGQDSSDSSTDLGNVDIQGQVGNSSDIPTQEASTGENKSSSDSVTMEKELEDQKLLAEGGDSLRTKYAQGVEILKNPNATEEQKVNARNDVNNYIRYQQIMSSAGGKKGSDALPSSVQIAGAHFKKAVNIHNHFQFTASSGGKFSQAYKAIFGTTHRDPHTGKKVYDGNGYFSQFNATNLFGLSDEDKKYLKEEGLVPLKAVGGSVALFLGLGAFVAHPAIGAGGIAYGASKYSRLHKQIKGPAKYKGTYGKARFPAQTVQNTHSQLLKSAYEGMAYTQAIQDEEMRDQLNDLKTTRPEIYKAIMQDLKRGAPYSGLKLRGNVSSKQYQKAIGGNVSTAVPEKWSRMPQLFDSSSSTANMGSVERYALKRAQKETATFEKESANLLKIAHQQEMKRLIEKQDQKLEDGLLTEMQEINEGDEPSSQLQKYMADCAERGFEFDRETHSLKIASIDRANFNEDISEDKSKKVEATIDAIIEDMYKVSDKVDISSKEVMDQMLKALDSRLVTSGELDKKDSTQTLFKDRPTVEKVLRDRVDLFNKHISMSDTTTAEESKDKQARLDEAISKGKGFSEEEQKLIQQIVLESGVEGADATQIMTIIESQAQNNEEEKGKSKEQKDKERDGKIKAIAEYVKIANQVEVPKVSEATKAKISQEAVKKSVKKSKSKIRSVLQFMAESDGDIDKLMDSTEGKVKNASSKGITITDKNRRKSKSRI